MKETGDRREYSLAAPWRLVPGRRIGQGGMSRGRQGFPRLKIAARPAVPGGVLRRSILGTIAVAGLVALFSLPFTELVRSPAAQAVHSKPLPNNGAASRATVGRVSREAGDRGLSATHDGGSTRKGFGDAPLSAPVGAAAPGESPASDGIGRVASLRGAPSPLRGAAPLGALGGLLQLGPDLSPTDEAATISRGWK